MKHRLAIDGRIVEMTEDQLLGLATGKATKSQPQTFERRILWRVCENGTSRSATTIAAEEWQGPSDPVTEMTVTWALESLNEDGFVTYVLEGSSAGGERYRLEQPTKIRATRAGYLAAGYPPPVTILVGKHRNYHHDVPRHLNDTTDFRNFLDVAIGGPIERDSLEDHLHKYPDHQTIHPTMEDLMSREDINLAANAAGPALDPKGLVSMTVEQIMKERGVPLRQAYKIRREATAEVSAEGADHSLAQRILKILKNGDVKDVEDLRSALFFAHEDLSASNLDITRAVWSLQKRNLVTFYERKSGRDSLITKIKLTRQGMTEMGVLPERHSLKPDKVVPSRELKHPSPVGKDGTDYRRQPSVAPGGPIEVIPGTPRVAPRPSQGLSAPDWKTSAKPAGNPPRQNEKPEPPKVYPLIDELLARADKRKSYEDAARNLEGVDDEMALELLGKVALTPFEEEVVEYVRASRST